MRSRWTRRSGRRCWQELGADPERFRFRLPRSDRLVTAGRPDNQMPVLDLLPVMRQEHQTRVRLYVPNDTHWNERGNLVAGMRSVGASLDQLLPEPEGE